jgi:uncharacterized cupin superfamily protein
MPKIDLARVRLDASTGYPQPYRSAVAGRARQRLGDAAGLDQFGVNLTQLKPGAQSAQRHWHAAEDEFVFVIDGETILKAGDAAGFKAGVANGHCLVNRSAHDAVYLEIGTRCAREDVEYPDIDLRFRKDETGVHYLHKSGEPYRR